MESRRETVSDDGGDGDGDADPIRLRGAQREIRDAYFASDSGLFTLDCVPGAGKSVVAHHVAAEDILRRYAAGDPTPEQHVTVVSFNRDEAADIVPAICDRLQAIVEHDLVPTAADISGQSYDTSDSACDRPLTRAPSMDSCARYSGNSRAISVSTRCRRSGTTRS